MVNIENKKFRSFLQVLNGSFISIALTLILILAFAFIIRFTNMNESWIFPINQIIKIVSLFVGIFITFRNIKEKGLLKGLIIGLFYYLFSYLTFSLLQNNWNFKLNNFYDLILTSFTGGLIGIISINIRK